MTGVPPVSVSPPYVPIDTNQGITAVFRMEQALTVGEAAQGLERSARFKAHLPQAVLFGSATAAMGYNVLSHGAEVALATAHVSPLIGVLALGATAAMALAQVSMTVIPSFFDRRNNPDVPKQVTLESLSKTIQASAKQAVGLEKAWLAVRADSVLGALGYMQLGKPRLHLPVFNQLQNLPAVNVLRQTSALWEQCSQAERDEAVDMLACYNGQGDLAKLSDEGRALTEAAIENAIAVSKEEQH